MGEDIILTRNDQPSLLELDEDERALLDGIEISKDKVIEVTAPKRSVTQATPRFRPPPSSQRQRIETTEEPEMDAFINQSKRSGPTQPDYYGEEEEEEEEEEVPEYHQGGGGFQGPSGEQPSEGFSSIDDEKADLLNKLARLEKKGFNVNKRLNAYSSISELRTEYKRITYSIEVDSSIKFSRRMMVACVSGLEFLNKRYNPVDVYLEGWSENVVENLDDYDGVFEELYNKYKTKMAVAPEVKLIMMLGGSAMMFHLTNSMFKAAVPNMNDILKKNPDLVKNMVEAVQSSQKPSDQPNVDENGRHEMKGPGIDLTSLMGGMMMPPPPINTSQKTATLNPVDEDEDEDDDISDIVSVSGDSTGGELRDVTIKPGGNRRRRTKKKKEINL